MTVIYNNLYWDHEPIDTYYWHHHIIITMASQKMTTNNDNDKYHDNDR